MSKCRLINLHNTWENSAKAPNIKFKIIGSKSANTWFGIYSTDKIADIKDSQGKEQDYREFNDFILDDLLIKEL